MGILGPKERMKLMEQFRPPQGFRLDCVIGTTFSLDLLSLLMAPLAMVMFEHEDKDEALKDPTAMLEALRLTTDRIAVFCQKGRISVPQKENYLFSYLEPMVIEVEMDDQNGVFHPKIWLLRYSGKERKIVYRFLCLSRNLTFDRSWDTVFSIEGEYDSTRQRAFSKNRPLSDFVAALAKLSRNVSPSVLRNIKLMTDEVLRVRFDFEPFEDMVFHPIGIEGYKKGPKIDGYNRTLIISPFLSQDMLESLGERGKKIF